MNDGLLIASKPVFLPMDLAAKKSWEREYFRSSVRKDAGKWWERRDLHSLPESTNYSSIKQFCSRRYGHVVLPVLYDCGGR
jgi:hypothetical protein